MKHFSLSTIAGLTVGITLIAYSAFAWTAPLSSAPGGNTAAPLNISSASQTKSGSLTLGGGLNIGGPTGFNIDNTGWITTGLGVSGSIRSFGDIIGNRLCINDGTSSDCRAVWPSGAGGQSLPNGLYGACRDTSGGGSFPGAGCDTVTSPAYCDTGTPPECQCANGYTKVVTGNDNPPFSTIHYYYSCMANPGTGGTDDSLLTMKHYFITAATFNGNLGGQTGATAKCNADTSRIVGKTYKAVLDNNYWHQEPSDTSAIIYWNNKYQGFTFSGLPSNLGARSSVNSANMGIWGWGTEAGTPNPMTCKGWTTSASTQCGWNPGANAFGGSSGAQSTGRIGFSPGQANNSAGDPYNRSCLDDNNVSRIKDWHGEYCCTWSEILCSDLSHIFCVEN